MKILVINAGSSSMKFTLFSMANDTVLAKGQFERLGTDKPNMIYKRADGFKFEGVIPVKDHVEAVREICAKLVDPQHGVIKSLSEISAIGHRVLLGGEKITRPVKVDDGVKEIIREYIPLGPLHNPANLAGIEACEAAMPGVPNVAVFDTQFHQTMPPEAYLYAIPYEFYQKYGIRKYGYHGTSHHLIDTSMGLTPLEGLMMGTRSGDLDPAAVIRLIDLGFSTKEVDTILNKKSGLYGVGGIGSGDMRDNINAAAAGNEQAELALKMFARRVIKYIGSYYVLLGGADAVVFTGGVGEYSVPMRKRIMNGITALGIKLDDKRNEACSGSEGIISTDDSSFKAIVMPTNEELMIAMSTVDTLGLKK